VNRFTPAQIPENAILIDVRDELEAMASPLEAIAGQRNVIRAPLTDLEDGVIPEIPSDAPVIVVCGNGSKGELAGAYLQAAGKSNINVLEGGFRAWKREFEGENTLEFRVFEIDNIRDALALQGKLELLPGVRMAGVGSDGLTVVRGITTFEQLTLQLKLLGFSLEENSSAIIAQR
jgi:rhodanese-related sulfurtransferase